METFISKDVQRWRPRLTLYGSVFPRNNICGLCVTLVLWKWPCQDLHLLNIVVHRHWGLRMCFNIMMTTTSNYVFRCRHGTLLPRLPSRHTNGHNYYHGVQPKKSSSRSGSLSTRSLNLSFRRVLFGYFLSVFVLSLLQLSLVHAKICFRGNLFPTEDGLGFP